MTRMAFLLDTSALIDIFVNRKDSEKIREYVRGRDFFISSISVYEIRKAKQLDARIDLFIRSSGVVELDEVSAEHAAIIFKRLKERGMDINEADILIAGIVRSRGFELITKDNDFRNIAAVDNQFKVTLF